MTEIIYTQEEWTNQVMLALPQGDVWRKDPSSNLWQAIYALMGTFADEHASAAGLIADAFPGTTVNLLPEWEASLGLPDPCAGVAPTVEQRRNQVVARFASLGGQSTAFIIQFAENLGYTITITEFGPLTSESDSEASAYDTSNVWCVNGPYAPINYLYCDTGYCDDYLETGGLPVLECEIEEVKPAQSIVYFTYAIDNPLAFTGYPSTAITGGTMNIQGSVYPLNAEVQIALGTSYLTPPTTGWIDATVINAVWTAQLTAPSAGTYFVWAQIYATSTTAVTSNITIIAEAPPPPAGVQIVQYNLAINDGDSSVSLDNAPTPGNWMVALCGAWENASPNDGTNSGGGSVSVGGAIYGSDFHVMASAPIPSADWNWGVSYETYSDDYLCVAWRQVQDGDATGPYQPLTPGNLGAVVGVYELSGITGTLTFDTIDQQGDITHTGTALVGDGSVTSLDNTLQLGLLIGQQGATMIPVFSNDWTPDATAGPFLSGSDGTCTAAMAHRVLAAANTSMDCTATYTGTASGMAYLSINIPVSGGGDNVPDDGVLIEPDPITSPTASIDFGALQGGAPVTGFPGGTLSFSGNILPTDATAQISYSVDSIDDVVTPWSPVDVSDGTWSGSLTLPSAGTFNIWAAEADISINNGIEAIIYPTPAILSVSTPNSYVGCTAIHTAQLTTGATNIVEYGYSMDGTVDSVSDWYEQQFDSLPNSYGLIPPFGSVGDEVWLVARLQDTPSTYLVSAPVTMVDVNGYGGYHDFETGDYVTATLSYPTIQSQSGPNEYFMVGNPIVAGVLEYNQVDLLCPQLAFIDNISDAAPHTAAPVFTLSDGTNSQNTNLVYYYGSSNSDFSLCIWETANNPFYQSAVTLPAGTYTATFVDGMGTTVNFSDVVVVTDYQP